MDKSKFLVIFSVIIILFFAASGLQAGLPSAFDAPVDGYLSNVVIDIIEHDGGIWLATGKGVSFSMDDGNTWQAYTDENGLYSPSISAFYSVPTATSQRLWLATNHVEWIVDANFNISDGVSYTDDNGALFTRVNFGEDGLNIPNVWGGDRIIYDITGHYDPFNAAYDNWLFFSSFAGGFLVSKDGGENWRRIFASKGDSVQYNAVNAIPSLRNLYFSCVADTSHGDSLFVWAGTAEGFFAYIFAEPKDKLSSKNITRIFHSPLGEHYYMAGDEAYMQGAKSTQQFVSRFTGDGLPDNNITAVFEVGAKIFVGTVDETIGFGALSTSIDNGQTFTLDNPGVGFAAVPYEITDFTYNDNNGLIYMAAQSSGLYVSSDTGLTWDMIYVDSSDMSIANQRNSVNALDVQGDTLFVGTDSGLVHLFLAPDGAIDSSRYFVFDEDATSSTKITRLKVQNFQGNNVIWTVNHPLSLSGTPIVGRSSNGGLSFTNLQIGVLTNDVNFVGDTTFVVSNEGIRITPDSVNPGLMAGTIYEVKEYVNSVQVDSLNLNVINSMEVAGDTIYFGTDDGLAVSYDRGETYNITRVNNDSLAADAVLRHTMAIAGIDGNWHPAMAIQYTNEAFARTWVSTRPAFGGIDGISVGFPWPVLDTTVTPNDTLSYVRIWGRVSDEFAWNYTFNGDTIFAATDNGLIWGSSDSLIYGSEFYNWNRLDLVDEQGVQMVLPGTPVYACEVIGNNLWVGTDDRSVKINLSNLSDQTPLFVTDDQTADDEVYAFPVPFSQYAGLGVDFHFVLNQDADVTIEIYDFAMKLVDRIIENVPLTAGTYPTAGSGRPVWDGRNGQGEEVAVGIYYFKIEYSTGEVRWGKLAVIP